MTNTRTTLNETQLKLAQSIARVKPIIKSRYPKTILEVRRMETHVKSLVSYMEKRGAISK